MTDLTIFDESVALVKKNAPQNGMPLLCWDLYSVFFRALNAAQRDLSLLNQLSKDFKWSMPFDLDEELQTNDAILVTDANLEIVFASYGIAGMSGYEPSEVVGNSPKMFQGRDTTPKKRAEINQAIATQKPFEATLINYKKNGEIYECHIRSFPIFNKKGELTHFIALEKAA